MSEPYSGKVLVCFLGVLVTWMISEADILHLNLMGSHLIVFNDSDVATDLVERRSVVYSDRVCQHSNAPRGFYMLTSTSF